MERCNAHFAFFILTSYSNEASDSFSETDCDSFRVLGTYAPFEADLNFSENLGFIEALYLIARQLSGFITTGTSDHYSHMSIETHNICTVANYLFSQRFIIVISGLPHSEEDEVYCSVKKQEASSLCVLTQFYSSDAAVPFVEIKEILLTVMQRFCRIQAIQQCQNVFPLLSQTVQIFISNTVYLHIWNLLDYLKTCSKYGDNHHKLYFGAAYSRGDYLGGTVKEKGKDFKGLHSYITNFLDRISMGYMTCADLFSSCCSVKPCEEKTLYALCNESFQKEKAKDLQHQAFGYLYGPILLDDDGKQQSLDIPESVSSFTETPVRDSFPCLIPLINVSSARRVYLIIFKYHQILFCLTYEGLPFCSASAKTAECLGLFSMSHGLNSWFKKITSILLHPEIGLPFLAKLVAFSQSSEVNSSQKDTQCNDSDHYRVKQYLCNSIPLQQQLLLRSRDSNISINSLIQDDPQLISLLHTVLAHPDNGDIRSIKIKSSNSRWIEMTRDVNGSAYLKWDGLGTINFQNGTNEKSEILPDSFLEYFK